MMQHTIEHAAPLPSRFGDLKKEIALSTPNFEAQAMKAWTEIVGQLKMINQDIGKNGSQVFFPYINYLLQN
jgi:hypothetical protein